MMHDNPNIARDTGMVDDGTGKKVVSLLLSLVEHGSSVVECRTRNQVSPGSDPPLLTFRRLCIFILSITMTPQLTQLYK